MTKEAETKYRELFSDEAKIAAFDEIAKRYYFSNFATMSKTDFETLLFSLYLERILEKNQANYGAYSDYTLSKDLGISQGRVSTLKVRKQLQYPYAKFDWKQSFQALLENATYEDKKIVLMIPDKNLYLEIKNAVESSGGYVEMQLTPNLLKINPGYFIDLVAAISDEEERKKIRKQVKKWVEDKNGDVEFLEKKSVGQQLKNIVPEMAVALFKECIPAGPLAAELFSIVANLIEKQQNK